MTENSYWSLPAQITRWVDDHFPGFVECRFLDRFNHEWVIVDKVPVITNGRTTSSSVFPIYVSIACTVIDLHSDETNRRVAKITLAKPWGIETTDGETEFEIFEDQLERIISTD